MTAQQAPAFAPPQYPPHSAPTRTSRRFASMPQPQATPIAANDTDAAFGPYARYQPPGAEMSQPALRDATVAQWADELARREAEVSVRPVEPQPQPQVQPMTENVVALPVRPAAPSQEPRGVDVE